MNQSSSTPTPTQSPRWLLVFNWLGLLVITIATLTGAVWLWGLLFLVWSDQGFVTGTTFVLTLVERRTHPITYWVASLLWLVRSVIWLVSPFLPKW